MKKMVVFALAALLVLAFTLPASALESQFGGYWRTRMYTNQNFTGEDESEAKDLSVVDTRTRLYYTAVFNENLKFVNKFEFNFTWGDLDGGDIGADGKTDWRVKNSYVDFNVGPVNAKVGIQGATIARGFLLSDDFSGAIVTYKGENFSIPLLWLKAYEGNVTDGRNVALGGDRNDYDVDYYGILPTFTIADVTINPFFVYAYSKDASVWPAISALTLEELNMWYAGLNVDAKFSSVSVWATGIYQGGEADLVGTENSIDFKAWLAAAGFGVDLPFGDVHGQFFYATGQSNDADADEWELFFLPSSGWNSASTTGQSYYWAEIMGMGIFDNYTTSNCRGDKIGNIMAANMGVTVKPIDKLTLTLDVWYAQLAEDNALEENYLGTEVDLIITYKLVEGLNLDVVGAYLFAGEATYDGENEADPYEIGTRLSLSF